MDTTYEYLMKFMAVRPRSEKEIRDWFKRKHVPVDLQTELYDRLKELGLVDDEAFTKWWINQRNTFRPRGKRALVYELRSKGVNKDLVDQVLTELDFSETELIKELIAKKAGKLDHDHLVSYLSRKGFSWEAIDQCMGADVQ